MDKKTEKQRAHAMRTLEALAGLLCEAESMNADLRAIGKGRPDDSQSPMGEARAILQGLLIPAETIEAFRRESER